MDDVVQAMTAPGSGLEIKVGWGFQLCLFKFTSKNVVDRSKTPIYRLWNQLLAEMFICRSERG